MYARALTDDDVLEDEGVVVRSRCHRLCGEQTEALRNRFILKQSAGPGPALRARFSLVGVVPWPVS